MQSQAPQVGDVAHFWIDRTSGVAGAVLTQLIPMFDEALLEVVAGFEMGVYAGI